MARPKLTELQKLANKRNRQYKKSSDEIMYHLSPIIEAVMQFSSEQEMYNPDEQTVELVAVMVDEDGSAMFTGSIKPNIGTVVDLYGEQFEVEDETMQGQLSQMMRIGVSSEVTAENTIEATLKYLNDWIEEQQAEMASNIASQLDASIADGTFDMSEEDKKDEDKLAKILEGATRGGLFS